LKTRLIADLQQIPGAPAAAVAQALYRAAAWLRRWNLVIARNR
jgi:hypothetical protein